jgi:hypothetical protein
MWQHPKCTPAGRSRRQSRAKNAQIAVGLNSRSGDRILEVKMKPLITTSGRTETTALFSDWLTCRGREGSDNLMNLVFIASIYWL